MKIAKIQSTPNFKSNPQEIIQTSLVAQQPQPPQKEAQPLEFIDKLLDKVKNPNDANDCVSVPRGIFKAYICLMTGTGLGAIAGLMPKALKVIKTPLNIIGSLLGILSAFYFAKPFVFKDLSKTVSRQDTRENK